QFAEAPEEEPAAAETPAEEEVPTPAQVFGEAEPDDGARPSAVPGPVEPAPAPLGRPTPARHAAPPQDDAIDLGATVLPVIARTYAPYAAVGLLAFILGWLFGRRR